MADPRDRLLGHAAQVLRSVRAAQKPSANPAKAVGNNLLDVAIVGLAGVALKKMKSEHAETIAAAADMVFGGTEDTAKTSRSDVIDAEFTTIPPRKP
jgi:hypothetical protein